MKFSERKQQEYYDEMSSWNWGKGSWDVVLSQEADINDPCSDEFYLQCYVGTVFGLTPSGKIYTFWTTNQTGRDIILDRAWWEAFERFLTERNWWQEHFDENIYVCRQVQDWVLWVNDDGEAFMDQPWPKGYYPEGIPEGYEPMACDETGTPFPPESGILIF